MSVKIQLVDGNDILLLTPGQIIKFENAKNEGKKEISLRFSRKQVKANLRHEGGFLGTLLSMATKVLPTLLGGLATGVISARVLASAAARAISAVIGAGEWSLSCGRGIANGTSVTTL